MKEKQPLELDFNNTISMIKRSKYPDTQGLLDAVALLEEGLELVKLEEKITARRINYFKKRGIKNVFRRYAK